jgi:prolipoprotein diacylglyceryltransferase
VPADLPLMPVMAALATAYALGEGVGRLACISFGCCYGKPMDQVHPLLRRLFARHAFVFTGPTKKIAYADGLDGREIFPIQAVTATLYCAAALAGAYLCKRPGNRIFSSP